jgi:hypothetical protein
MLPGLPLPLTSTEEGMETYYPQLWEQKAYLAGLKYKDIDISEFTQAENVLRQATMFLERETSVYFSLQEMINEVYAILLCEPYARMIESEQGKWEETVYAILFDISKAFRSPATEELFMNLMEKFTELEGVQEELSEDLTILEDTLYEIDKNDRALAESMMVDKLLNVLLRTKDLMSNSLFIDWNETKENKAVDEKVIAFEAKQLEKELSALFEEQDRAVSRAVMANTLSKMPVFFKNHKEIMEYVHYSLERCSDPNEKTACLEIICGIMSE